MMPKFVIDWRIEGSWQVEAKDAEEAQDKFDKAFAAGPRGIEPMRDGEPSNDKPVRVDGVPTRRQEPRR